MVAAEEEPWRRWLAPWTVRTADASGLDLDLFLPADNSDQQWRWEIAFEDGGTDYGTFRRENLVMLGAREIDGRRIEHRRLSLQRSGPIGYHRVRVSGPSEVEASLALAPDGCHVPQELLEGPDGRAWGLATHLYALRSQSNWGVGTSPISTACVRSPGKRAAQLWRLTRSMPCCRAVPATPAPIRPRAGSF